MSNIVVSGSSNASLSIFTDAAAFEQAQRVCKMLAASDIVPEIYRGNLANTLVAYDISQRSGIAPLMVMQNLNIIEGKPSWSSAYIIGAINSTGKYSPLRFEVKRLGKKDVPYSYWEGPKGARQKKEGKMTIEDISFVAHCTDKEGKELRGPAVTIEMAVLEGWYSKNGSKWPTMPELMGQYRAATFFGRLYEPGVLMGMKTADEIQDIQDVDYVDVTPKTAPAQSSAQTSAIADINAKVAKPAPKVSKPEPIPAPPAQTEEGILPEDNTEWI
jgi:hypothetical protein